MGKQLATLTQEIQKKNQSQWQEKSPSGVTMHSNNHRKQFGEVLPKSVRVDFPSFHGDDPNGWIYKVNCFFAFHNALPQHRLRLASFHMEGKAIVWFQNKVYKWHSLQHTTLNPKANQKQSIRVQKTTCNFLPRDWSKQVPLAKWWYNTNRYASTKLTVFEALYGYAPPHFQLHSQNSQSSISGRRTQIKGSNFIGIKTQPTPSSRLEEDREGVYLRGLGLSTFPTLQTGLNGTQERP